jgi:peptide/nickel transport system permease protein
MGTSQNLIPSGSAISVPSRARLLVSAARYLLGKALTIAATIFAGVLITIMLVSHPSGGGDSTDTSPFETRLLSQIDDFIQVSIYRGTIHRDAYGTPDQEQVDAITKELREEAGLNLPLLPRYLLWTKKALTFDWGRLNVTRLAQTNVLGEGASSGSNTVVLQFLPNTLLLVGTAYLLVFLIGMPLSLYLARHYDNWVDKFFAFLSPISSVPSWVFALLLIALFAVQLHWLPAGKMFEFHRSENPLLSAFEVARHMVLPVIAIVLSLLFQIIYTWRTFFIIYSEEDYVELAHAKGLPHKMLEKQYILKPALPYVITSMATTLIGFWQLTIALEKIFQWPGIGWLYIDALPNYWGEVRRIGDLMIVIQIVVTFAYVLGILVFILDLIYVIVDPRIHLIPASSMAQTRARIKVQSRGWDSRLLTLLKRKRTGLAQPVEGPVKKRGFSSERFLRDRREVIRELSARSGFFLRELGRYPSAMFGLAIITLMLIGSIYAVTALPYEEFGRAYDENRVTGENIVPQVAAPKWTNIFSGTPRLSTLIMDENSPQVSVSRQMLENGWVEKTTTFKFDYAYREIPSDVFLHIDSTYAQKLPFVSLTWMTPDGRSMNLKAKSVSGNLNYDFESGFSVKQLLNRNPQWKKWFVLDGQYPTPAYQLLFATPGAAGPTPEKGTYQLEIKSLLFETDADVHPQLVLLGQVYGAAGTDYWRRDLVVPLLWGMPFTLIIGFLGTLVTLLIAMLLPAIGVWYGGWLDSFIQRLTEVNMVLPGLAIAVLAHALFGVHIWIVLGIVVLLNAFGAPIKTFRSALLQAKEAPYIEMARSYGAGDFRIIMHYLVPRILPVLIPQLVALVPSFIFLEATLGLFNIKSDYPSWGRIIYEGLARGALYGSPFWVLEPIFLLLLTGFAFAMLGSALERILNPRIIADIPMTSDKVTISHPKLDQTNFNKRVIAISIVMVLFAAIFVPSIEGKTLASAIFNFIDQGIKYDTRITKPSFPIFTRTSDPSPASLSTDRPIHPTEPLSTQTAIPSIPSTSTATQTIVAPESTRTPIPTDTRPMTYTLHPGEFPYCIARRFNVDPKELLTLNGLSNGQTFLKGMVLQIPQTANPFPGERRLRDHPRSYTITTSNETTYTIACQFGDLDPVRIAEANHIAVDSILLIGQQLNIP